MQVLALRHTEVALPPGICYGRTDVPAEPAQLAARLPGIAARVRAVWPERDGPAQTKPHLEDAPFMGFSSPLARARALHGHLQELLIQDPHGKGVSMASTRIDARLQELDFGAWEGRAWNEIPRAQIDDWVADLAHHAPPEGESLAQLDARVQAWWRECISAPPHARVLVVAHAGPIRTMILRALGRPLKDYALVPLDFGEGVLFDLTGHVVSVRRLSGLPLLKPGVV
jgi:alpha-ribazole phosphatase